MGLLAVNFTRLAGNASSWVKLNMAVVHLWVPFYRFLLGLQAENMSADTYKTDGVVSRVLFI